MYYSLCEGCNTESRTKLGNPGYILFLRLTPLANGFFKKFSSLGVLFGGRFCCLPFLFVIHLIIRLFFLNHSNLMQVTSGLEM